jgi:protoporphyrinogen oxidase
VWGVPSEALVAETVRCRSEATAVGLLRSAARHLVGPATFLYPARGGFGSIVDALAAGVRVETGRRVTRLIEQHDRVIVGLSDGRLVSAAHVHATLPVWQVTAMLDLHREPSPPPSRALVLVYLVLDRRPYTAYDTHVLADRQLLPTQVSEPTQYRDDPADPPDRTVLCAEVPCWAGDHLWTAPDAALVQRVCDDLVRAGLPDPRPVASHVERLPSVHPVLTRDAAGALGRAERALSLSRRVSAVSPVLPEPGTIEQDLQIGLAAARCISDDGTFDHDAWRSARDDFSRFRLPN